MSSNDQGETVTLSLSNMPNLNADTLSLASPSPTDTSHALYRLVLLVSVAPFHSILPVRLVCISHARYSDVTRASD